MLFPVLLGFGTFLITLLGTRLVILTLRQKRWLMDFPVARSNHRTPVPRGGGIAIVFALMIALPLADASYWLLAGVLLLAAVSVVDDWVRLPVLVRLVAQIAAVGMALHEVPLPLLEAWLPHAWVAGVAALGWLWFVNLFNFMDGIDGLAAAETVSIGAGLLFLTTLQGQFGEPLSLLALVLMAAGAGFLWWNWHPAKIFLGDVGSIPLGFALGYALLSAAGQGYAYAALIVPAYFLADATLTLLWRAWRKQPVWQAHSEHFYQRAVRAGHRHDAVVHVVLGVNLLLIMLAALATFQPAIGWVYLSIAYGLVLAVLHFYMAHPPEETVVP